jgi:FAD/FMN-containing dehydrogenase
MDSSVILERGSEDYETSRRRFFNKGHPDRYPHQIIHPRSSAEVAAAVKHATSLDKHISVRSGGHLFPCQHLQDDEILIDMKNVNAKFEYDSETQLINFGPGLTVRGAQEFLTPLQLFFPFGHSPTVGLGGFLLAGGQGYFMQGWGMTADRWLIQMEIVTADGEIRICNREQNSDLFWAARGGGMGFFGVVTMFWGRTTRAKKLYNTHWVFSADIYEDAFNWILDSAKLIRPHNTEVAICVCYADKYTGQGDEIQSKDVIIAAAVTIYADSLEEAQSMAYPFNKSPLKPVFHLPVVETTFEELNKMQEGLLPSDQGLRYKCDSIYNDPHVSRKEVHFFINRLTLVITSNKTYYA